MPVIPSILLPFFHPPDFGVNPALDAIGRWAEFKDSGDLDSLKYERTFSEKELNNTLAQANDLGQLSPTELFHISGHLNGEGDTHDYFTYTASQPGNIEVVMINDDNAIIYNETFAAPRENDPFHYYGWAEGNADFNYDTFISLSLIA